MVWRLLNYVKERCAMRKAYERVLGDEDGNVPDYWPLEAKEIRWWLPAAE